MSELGKQMIIPNASMHETARLAGHIGHIFARAGAAAVEPMINDPTVAPTDMMAALIESHLLGVAAALCTAQEQGMVDQPNEAMGEHAGKRITRLMAAVQRNQSEQAMSPPADGAKDASR